MKNRKLNISAAKGFTAVLAIVAIAAFTACGGENTTEVVNTDPMFVELSPEDVTDERIESALENRLTLDPHVSGALVDVGVVDGVVTFSGAVDDLLAMERAERLAMSTVGVRSIVNNITFTPPEKDAEILAADVNAAFVSDPATDAFEIFVEANEAGEVTLNGTVTSWQEADLAVKVAKSVRGVTGVENNLDVILPEDRPDVEIAADVKQRLKFDVNVDHRLIEIDVTDGAVTLTGTVGSLYEKWTAEEDAWVVGVKSVDASGLDVVTFAMDEMNRPLSDVPPTDEEIEAAVEQALMYNPRVLSFEPNVIVLDRVVTLTGTVDSIAAKNAAEETAHNTWGVLEVNNELLVEPDIDPLGPEMSRLVKEALVRNAFVDATEITVEAEDGIVTLNGTVPTNFDVTMAVDAANRVAGVKGVINDLKVNQAIVTDDDDEKLEAAIRSEIVWDTTVDITELFVDAKAGVVTLQGTVDSWIERRIAGDIARRMGAVMVKNELAVIEEQMEPAEQDPSS